MQTRPGGDSDSGAAIALVTAGKRVLATARSGFA
jgi:hypothetical protein